MGGLAAGLDIWELSVIPMLLYNAECWQEMSNQTLIELDNLQNKFYRCLLAICTGCPIPALYWETGGMKMKYRILKKKLCFLHYIATLSDDTLAREFYEVQKNLALPGLVKECQEFLDQNEIVRIDQFTKNQWKNLVKRKMIDMNKDDLLDLIKSYKKLDYNALKEESPKQMEYLSVLNIPEVRMRFKLKVGMTPLIMMNFQSDKVQHLWKCSGCF